MIYPEQLTTGKVIYADIHQKIIAVKLKEGVIFHTESNSVGYNRWFGVKDIYFNHWQLEAILKYLQDDNFNPTEKISLHDYKIAQKYAMESQVIEYNEKNEPKIVCIDAKLYQIEMEGTNVSH